jgi:hypothetical protein
MLCREWSSSHPKAANQEMTPDNLAVFEQMRQEISPSEFSDDLLASAQEADPVVVAEFRAELQGLNLPPEVIDVLNNMVDEVLAAPISTCRSVPSTLRRTSRKTCCPLCLIQSSLAP